MTLEEIQVLGWSLAISVIVLVVSWMVLLLQAFFHDKRIALVGVFGASIAALAVAVSKAFSNALLAISGFICIGFLLLFIIQHYKNPLISICAICFLGSALSTYFIYIKILAQ